MRANFVGAAVSLDGTRVGITGTAPVVISDVSPGKHEVSVEKSGYTTTKQEFTLAAGQSLPLTLDLSPVSVEVPKPQGQDRRRRARSSEPARSPAKAKGRQQRSSGGPRRILGGGGRNGRLGGAGGEVRPGRAGRQPAARPVPPLHLQHLATGVCDSQGNPSQPLTAAQKSSVSTLTDQGNKDETLQWVFVGVGGAFAVAGGYLLYKGYLAAEGKPRRQPKCVQSRASDLPDRDRLRPGDRRGVRFLAPFVLQSGRLGASSLLRGTRGP